ncbi:low molecular weight phosphotyrosine protein phosphatase domain-containing protein [Ditylenchus destructor]|uniref:Low molecular weight phosphotyrosine protein phosphatase n=1 Tax=Ditylenchus destructor TaxID=166010 RepID=A0AAD4MWU5_9BILA|nr:low molecular weight phosphotyrosine protein phosphatase domain-containing protein [Ditylenchus destructor]
MSGAKKSVLFICLGNICRSPIAEAVFLDLLEKRNILDKWRVDSAATCDYHVGSGPESRAVSTLKKNGITTYQHVVREVTPADFGEFDFVFGMDENNIRDLKDVQKRAGNAGTKARVELLGDYDPEGVKIIVDPYYLKGTEAFDRVYEQCVRCCTAFLDQNS